jgi:hypothetical protein
VRNRSNTTILGIASKITTYHAWLTIIEVSQIHIMSFRRDEIHILTSFYLLLKKHFRIQVAANVLTNFFSHLL